VIGAVLGARILMRASNANVRLLFVVVSFRSPYRCSFKLSVSTS
jgi:hypothetical protein